MTRANGCTVRAHAFGADLARTLEGRWQARLTGSWATSEAHLPPPLQGWVASFSDVDLVVPSNLSPFHRSAIVDTVVAYAVRACLSLARVSVRSKDEMDLLPHSAVWKKASRPNASDAKALLIFWTSISVVEAAILACRFPDRPEEARSYGMAKVFLTLVRNAQFLRGCSPPSYHALVQGLARSPELRRLANCAIAIKLGA